MVKLRTEMRSLPEPLHPLASSLGHLSRGEEGEEESPGGEARAVQGLGRRGWVGRMGRVNSIDKKGRIILLGFI